MHSTSHAVHVARSSHPMLAEHAVPPQLVERPFCRSGAGLGLPTSSSPPGDTGRPRKRRKHLEDVSARPLPLRALEPQPTVQQDFPISPPVPNASPLFPVEARLFKWIASRAPVAGHSASAYASTRSGGDDGTSWRASTTTLVTISESGGGGGEVGGSGGGGEKGEGGGGGKRGRKSRKGGGDGDKPKRAPRKTEQACLFCRGESASLSPSNRFLRPLRSLPFRVSHFRRFARHTSST